jgi:hypothetical protein
MALNLDGSTHDKAPAHIGVVVPCRNIRFSLGLQINISFIDENTLDPKAVDAEFEGHNFPTIQVPTGARAPYKMD